MSTKTMAKTGNGQPFSSLINDFFRPWNGWFTAPEWNNVLTVPAVNVSETDRQYQLSVAAPGLRKEDFKIDVQGNTLTINAEKEDDVRSESNRYSRREYNYSSFCRIFTLPEEVTQDAIQASYADGVLQLILPKDKVSEKTARTVKVQ